MASLTSVLPEVNFTPQAIGGARQANFVGDLAEGAADLGRAINNSNGSGTKKTNDPVLDEAAMRIFQDQSGIQLGDPGYDEVVFAKRLDKAKKTGTMDATTYDIRMQSTVAELMRKYPNSAEEIMAKAYSEWGIDHQLFREAQDASKLADNKRDRLETAKATTLAAATESGLWDGQDETQGLYIGTNFLSAKANLAAEKAATEALYQRWQMGDSRAKAQISEHQAAAGRRFMGTATITFQQAMQNAYNLLGAAGTDADKTKAFDAEMVNVQLGFQQLTQSGDNFMQQFEKSFIGKDGMVHTIGFDEKTKAEWQQWLVRSKSMIDELSKLDLNQKKMFLEKWTAENKISAAKQLPVAMSMVDGVFGGSWAQYMDVITNAEKYPGVDAKTISAMQDSFAQGIDNYVHSATSAQSIQQLTEAGAMPSSNSNVEVSEAAFQHNSNVYKLSGGQLINGSWSGPGEANNSLNNFKNSYEDLIYAIRKNYTPNNITNDVAGKALNSLFSNLDVMRLEAYEKQGGSPDVAKMFYSQSAIAASTMVEGLRSRYKINWNPQLQKFEPQTETFNFAQYGDAYPQTETYVPAEWSRAATLANKYMSYIAEIDKRNPVIDKNLTDAAGKSAVQLIGEEKGLKEAIQAGATLAKAASEKSASSYFDKAIAANTDLTKGLVGGFNTNPFDDSPSYSSPAGQFQISAKEPPEELAPVIDSAAKEFNIDPQLARGLFQQESSYNQDAIHPVIDKFKGTGDERAIGLGGVLPSTGKEMGYDVNTVEGNAKASMKYLRTMLDRYGDDPVVALMAYNWGPGGVDKWLKSGMDPSRVPEQTRDYVKRILGVDVTELQ